MSINMEFINLLISGEEDVDRELKIKVFNLNSDKNREEYEELMNSDSAQIIEEYGPTLDKLGRSMLTVK